MAVSLGSASSSPEDGQGLICIKGPCRLRQRSAPKHEWYPRDGINRARRQIHERGAEASVADIAYDAGLPHAGRFSQEFEDVFDELPSHAAERSKSRLKT